MKKRRLLMMLAAVLICATSMAQGIKGSVIDENGEPVIGATIVDKANTPNATITDLDLIRWGDAKTTMGKQGKDIPSFTAEGVQWYFHNDKYGFQDKNMLLPIPLKELELNPNMQPNAGW